MEEWGRAWQLGRKLRWDSSEQGAEPELEEVLGRPAPFLPLPTYPPTTTGSAGSSSPSLSVNLGPASAPAWGRSLLTLLLFKVDLKVLLLLFINFYTAHSLHASPICPV